MAEAILPNKTCPQCGCSRPVSEFSPHRSTKDRLQSKCKPCRRQECKEWRSKNPNYRMAYYLVNKATENANTPSKKARKKAYYESNKNREIERALIWAKENAGVMAARAMHRIALRRKATPSWADMGLILNLYEKAKKLQLDTGLEWHVDHIVPLNSALVCGLHVHHNLQILPASENIAKGNRNWPDMP